MKQAQILQVLYDLALTIGSKTAVRPLVSDVLRRLLYHTSTTCALFITDVPAPEDRNGRDTVEVTLFEAIGGGQIRHLAGQTVQIPAALLEDSIGEISDTDIINRLFDKNHRYQCGLRLPINAQDFIFLFAPEKSGDEIRPDLIFAPIIANFDRSLHMCRVNERIMSELRAELDNRQRLEEQLIKKEKLAVVGQITSSVNHELRNPLGAIKSSTYLIRRKLVTGDDSWIDQLDTIERNTERCNSIIDQLLGYTRHTKLSLKPVNIPALIETSLEDLDIPDSIAINRPDHSVPLPTVRGDKEQLRRVLVNILQNSLQAMDGQEPEDPPRVSEIAITSRVGNRRLEIVCRDTGPGIQPDELERIFEPLYSTKSFGVGLGMPIVRNIMIQHGGDVEITSREGIGTSVLLWLPLTLSPEGS